MNKPSRGLSTGLILGVLFLVLSLGLYIWAPDFTGFANNRGAEPAMPIWNVLLLLALVNFVYAGASHFLQRKLEQHPQEPRKPDEGD